jgi:hypothetical protein
MAAAEIPRGSEREWYIVNRWLEFEGEARANLLRAVAVGAFYAVQLYQYYIVKQADPALLPFHQQATALAVAWALLALGVTLCLRRQIFPAALKYVSTGCDIALLAALVWLAGGPNLAIVRAFFLVLALAALRFDLGLIWFTTLGCMAAYEALVGHADKKWFDAEHAVPPVDNLVMLVSLALMGVILGQVIRRSRQAAVEYARRMERQGGRS